MELILTKKYQYGKRCPDGRSRNYLIYFLNGKQILKQKIPYLEDYERGHDKRTAIYNDYLLDGRIHQERYLNIGGCGSLFDKNQVRHVKYPISRRVLNEFNIPAGTKIEIISK